MSPGGLDDLLSVEGLVASEMVAVESRRTLDRLRLQGALTNEEASDRAAIVADWLEAIDLALLRAPVLSRASDPLPTALGSVDASHLASALVWRDRVGPLAYIATHDAALGLAARSFGFEVRGV